MNIVSIKNGLIINGTRINGLIGVKIESSVDNMSEISIKFLGKVDGLDNIQPRYNYFPEQKREYKPKRKFKSCKSY